MTHLKLSPHSSGYTCTAISKKKKKLYSLRSRVLTPEEVTLIDQDRIVVSVEGFYDRRTYQSDNCDQFNIKVGMLYRM